MIKKRRQEDSEMAKSFHNERKNGPTFYCVCCHTARFQRSVQHLTPKLKKLIADKNMSYYITTTDDMKCHGKLWICGNCKGSLLKGKMPYISIFNGLEVKPIPEELQSLTDIEKMMIQKRILFLKVRHLPSSRMEVFNDRVINLKMDDENLVKNVKTLPRTTDNIGTVNVCLKRTKKLSQWHKLEKIRPKKINTALKFLQQNHPLYADLDIQELDETKEEIFVQLPIGKESSTNENDPGNKLND